MVENIDLSDDKKETLRGIVYNTPLVLTVIEDRSSIDYINSFLPYSIGIEFDTQVSEDYDLQNFIAIPDIMEIRNDSLEQRYRIPNGIKGMVCLYNLLEQMKLNNIFDELGGIHFHVDMTRTYKYLTAHKLRDCEQYILTELDKWKYPGTYNKRGINFGHSYIGTSGNWLRFQSGFKTAEFRICEMTFDYDVLIKRLIHGCEIISHLNNHIHPSHTVTYEYLDKDEIIKYIRKVDENLKSKIETINEAISEFTTDEEQNIIRKKLKKELISIVQSRIVNMYG